ncbi:hypothetical protein M9H77_04203 [Catharanthus roseus]|uniref:Uncharacterized protein n=1 Tax=Catharanthus roseus TaxID=4058 RepID=A0ACC0CDJ8_CATRO|nr:hypothetical protein M9H77_04203 [Catharanthus roseus]
MGLNCITSYKLDALKAVCQTKSDDSATPEIPDDVNGAGASLSLGLRISSSVATESLDDELISKKQYDSNEQQNTGSYASKAKLRKEIRKMRNGPGRNHSSGGRVEKSKGFLPNSFDRVLLDAPCSALGLRPRLFAGEETVESLRNHAKYQRRMFDQAVQLVRPGGVIVYSTDSYKSFCYPFECDACVPWNRCTINPGENEGLVRYALDKYKFLSLASQHPRIGGPGLVGGCELPDGDFEEWLRPGEEDLVQRFDPSAPLDTIGFFIAKFNVGLKND